MESKMIEVGDLVRIYPDLVGGDEIICLVERAMKEGFSYNFSISSISDSSIYFVSETQVEKINGDEIKNRNPE